MVSALTWQFCQSDPGHSGISPQQTHQSALMLPFLKYKPPIAILKSCMRGFPYGF